MNWKNTKVEYCNEKGEIFHGPIDYLYNFVSVLVISFQSIQSN